MWVLIAAAARVSICTFIGPVYLYTYIVLHVYVYMYM